MWRIPLFRLFDTTTQAFDAQYRVTPRTNALSILLCTFKRSF
ncbi:MULTISPECIES: hypothetical protein [Nitrosomonas]|nr:hypothetical protein [Nitrosomonas sp. H1_AOB3]